MKGFFMTMRSYAFYFLALSLSCSSSVAFAKKFNFDPSNKRAKICLTATNRVLEKNPENMLRMYLTHQIAQEIITSITRQEKNDAITKPDFIQKNICSLIQYVEPFVKTLRDKIDIVEPLIKESLGEEDSLRLIGYLQMPGNFKDALVQKITTPEQLTQLCELLRKFFLDIEENLTPKAKELLDEQVRKLEQLKAEKNK